MTNNYISIFFAFIGGVRLFMIFLKYQGRKLMKCPPFRLAFQYLMLVFILSFLLIDRINIPYAFLLIHAFFFLFFYMRIRKSVNLPISAMPELHGVSWDNIDVMAKRLLFFTEKFPKLMKTNIDKMLNDLDKNIHNHSKITANSNDTEKIQKHIADSVYALEQTLELMQYSHTPDVEVIESKIMRINRLLDKMEKTL